MSISVKMKPVVISILFFTLANASHFRGGTISWRYVGPGYKVQFKFKLSWRLGNADIGNWIAYPLNGGSSFPVGTVSYTMTANNSAESWEQGEKTFTYDFKSKGPYRVSYAGVGWISLAYGTGGNWNIQTIVDLNVRNDTLRPNYSPLTTSRAIFRVQFGCPISIQVPKTDADGDLVKCRWATAAEAASISMLLPNAVLDENTCAINFTADPGSNYRTNGWYAVAITVEDYPRQTISINGTVYNQTTPISGTPLQFLIKTENMSGSCDEKPEFKSPTPNEGSLVIIKANDTLRVGFYVHSSAGLKRIDVNGPADMTKTSLTADNQGRPNVWYVVISWTPRPTDQGSNIICSSAEDNNGKISESRCITVAAWDVDPCENEPCLNMGTCQRIGYTNDFTCTCVPWYTGIRCQTVIGIDPCESISCENMGTCQRIGHTNFTCICVPGYTGTRCQTGIDHCQTSPCLHGGVCSNHYGGFTCDCHDPWHGEICEYKHINKTEECTDLKYTECSCQISRIRSPVKNSYKILSGAVGSLVGLVITVLTYFMWSMLDRRLYSNAVKPEPRSQKDIVTVIKDDVEDFLKENTPDNGADNDNKNKLRDEKDIKSIKSSVNPKHCTCFVDHSGYDHFQRYDEKNTRFKFHKCQHKKLNT